MSNNIFTPQDGFQTVDIVDYDGEQFFHFDKTMIECKHLGKLDDEKCSYCDRNERVVVRRRFILDDGRILLAGAMLAEQLLFNLASTVEDCESYSFEIRRESVNGMPSYNVTPLFEVHIESDSEVDEEDEFEEMRDESDDAYRELKYDIERAQDVSDIRKIVEKFDTR